MRKCPTRDRVKKVFLQDPLASIEEIAKKIGRTPSLVSGYLCAMERNCEIVRPKRVREWRSGVKPTLSQANWNSGTQKGAIKRREGAMRPQKAKDADALRERIERVVAKAEQRGICFRADYVKLDQLGGCKCG